MSRESGEAVDWDAATYDRLADPQEEWGREVLARLDLKGDETVLDAGCGGGRVTRLLLERLPDGRVIGVDASPAMIEQAREVFRDDDRVELIASDLLELELDDRVDVVFSNATFHWILDHDRLFARLAALLRPGGRIEAQCGGEGNVAEFERAIDAIAGDERFAPYLRSFTRPWNFAPVGSTQSRLARVGFEDARVWLERKRVEPSEPAAFLRAVGLAPLLARLPDELHDAFVDAVIGSMPRPLVLEYVRLNISGTRGL